MIPIKLELKNFLSYGSDIQVINFKDHSLICLSGKNGNGKSALLDAMTWVLWGQARKVSGTIKPDEGLLRLGQTRMMVSLEFEFAKSIYRVRREYAKTYGKPLMVLDLELFDENKDKFLPLTEKTVRLTQAKIEKLLGLDYLTFTNSAFLRQGQADEFSKKSPKERKQILSNILGLSRYDDLSSLALKKSKILGEDYKVGLKLQDNDNLEILKEKDIKVLLKDEQVKLKIIKEDLKKIESDLKANEEKQNSFFKNKDKYLFFSKELLVLNNRCVVKTKELKELILLWKRVHYQSLKLESIDVLQKDKIELENQDKIYILNQKKSLFLQENLLKQKDLYQKKYTILKDKKNKDFNKMNLGIQRSGLELEQVVIQLNLKEKELKNSLEKRDLAKKELDNLYEILKLLPGHDKRMEEFGILFEKRRAFYAVLIQRGNWIKSSLAELKDKVESIKKQDSPCCPLCEQVLTIKRKSFLSSKFVKDIVRLKHRLIRPTSVIKKLKNVLLDQHKEFKELKDKDNYYKKQKAKLDELEKGFVEITKNIPVLEATVLLLQKNKKDSEVILKKETDVFKKLEICFEEELKEDKELKEIRLKLEKTEKEKKILKYDSSQHKKVQKDLLSVSDKLSQLEKQKENHNLQKEKKVKVGLLIQQLKELKDNIRTLDDSIKSLKFDLNSEKELNKKLLEIKEHQETKTKEKDSVLKQSTLFEYELKKIKELKKLSEKRIKELNLLQDQLKDYQLLSQAFGKNGIQALLIEQAIPQIEEEANNILGRLTDNQSQIFIESLRDLKSGGARETLDIKISDYVGIRPYEMFSGGEAFRVDFALRIAISKLLARRAGIALQTLIIDEGFGSQDEDGLSRLMDAIYAIKKDFSKVIVVSHLAMFKDNFPVHFVIQKGSGGSFVTVQERG